LPGSYKHLFPLEKGLSSMERILFAKISRKSSYETSKIHKSSEKFFPTTTTLMKNPLRKI
jgi:tryptophanase